MPDSYTTREAVKTAAQIAGPDLDDRVDDAIQAATREIENLTRTWFIPRTETRSYQWPIPRSTYAAYVLPLDAPLLAVTALTREGDDAVALAAADYYLEPANAGPPYHRIELNRGSASAYFQTGDTPQRALRVTGRWAECETTRAAGTLAAAVADATATTLQVKNGAAVGVGAALLLGTEQLRVTDKAKTDLGVNLSGNLAADRTAQTLTLSGAPADPLNAGEVVWVDAERFRVTSVTSSTVCTVVRAYDGSTLAAHTDGADVYVERELTVERGVNGTTAAAHDDDAVVLRYVVPADVEALARAEALALLAQDAASWGREIGGGENAVEFRGSELAKLRDRVRKAYRRRTLRSV